MLPIPSCTHQAHRRQIKQQRTRSNSLDIKDTTNSDERSTEASANCTTYFKAKIEYMSLSLLLDRTPHDAEASNVVDSLESLSKDLLLATSHDQLQQILMRCQYFEMRGYELELSSEQQQFVLVTEMIVLILMGEYDRAKNLYHGVHSALSFFSRYDDEAFDILWNLTDALLRKDSSKTSALLERMNSSTYLNFVSEKMTSFIRQRLAYQMAFTFKTIRLSVASHRLGFATYDDALNYLSTLGWTKATTTTDDDDIFLLRPPNSSKQQRSSGLLLPSSSSSTNNYFLSFNSEMEHKLQYLTATVAFLEQKRTNT